MYKIAVCAIHSCAFNRHAERLKIPSNNFYRISDSDLISQSLAFIIERLRFLTSHFLPVLSELSNVQIAAIDRFIFGLGLGSMLNHQVQY